MNWFIWILISIVTTAVSNLLTRVIMREKDSNPYATTVIFQFAVGFLTFLFALWYGFVIPPIQTFFWNFLIGTILWGLTSYFGFKAYQLIGSSEIAILSSFGTIVTILSAMLFLGESFNLQKTVGVILIVSSIFLVNIGKNKFILGQGVLYAILSTICAGLAVTNDAFILKTYDAVSYTAVISFLPGVLLLLLRPTVILKLKRLQNFTYVRTMLFLAIFYAASAVAYYMALHLGADASMVAPIAKSSIILTVLLAVIFLKEKEKMVVKLIAAILVTAGVLLVR